MSTPAHQLRFKVRLLEPFPGEVEVALDLGELAERMARYAIQTVRGKSDSQASAKMQATVAPDTIGVRNGFLALNGQRVNANTLGKVFRESNRWSKGGFEAPVKAELIAESVHFNETPVAVRAEQLELER